jgi:Dullard-like phosphatase family protein
MWAQAPWAVASKTVSTSLGAVYPVLFIDIQASRSANDLGMQFKSQLDQLQQNL